MSMPSSETLFSRKGSGDSSAARYQVLSNGDGFAKSNMLSLNFSSPLTGQARTERLNQMMNSHPAFEKSRATQALLVRIQTTLRRMPGIAANESAEIIGQLQEVGQVISQETTQLVEAMASLTLELEESEKSVTKMSLDSNLAKARSDDNVQIINNLKDELASIGNKRDQAEAESQKIMQDLRELSADFKDVKDKADAQRGTSGNDDLVKTLEDTIKHLEDQVNNRRSLWVMKHSDPESVARAVETLTGSVQDNEAVHRTLMSLRSESFVKSERDGGDPPEPNPPPFQPPARIQSVFQTVNSMPRPLTTAPPTTAPPPKFGPLQVGPPRAPSVVSNERRYQGAWGPPPPISSRSTSMGNSLVQTPPFGRGAPRKGGWQNASRYRPSAPDYQPSNFNYQDNVPSRPMSAYGNRQNFYPSTPTSAPRNRYGRFQDFSSPAIPEYADVAGLNNALTSHVSNVGPLIQMTDRTMGAWRDRIMEFYTAIRNFVEDNAALPQDGLSAQLSSSEVWPVLIKTYMPLSENEAASYLDFHLKNTNSKACIVTRVIIDYAVNRVWVPTAWAGVDAETSHVLSELQNEFERTQGQPSAIRQPLLDRQAAILDSVMKRDQINIFYKNKVEEIAGHLLTTLSPLLNKHTNPAQAYRDLETVADSAWELSSSILTSRLTFDFRFPEIGSRFSAQSMVPIWPVMEPLELQSRHFRVAMVTTPVVTVRNDTGTNISAHSVALADVFCMQ